jgi:hypothetical protein
LPVSQIAVVAVTKRPHGRRFDITHVVETKTDAAYEKYTGIEGRHLMVKELG